MITESQEKAFGRSFAKSSPGRISIHRIPLIPRQLIFFANFTGYFCEFSILVINGWSIG
jgi:hypothetical protein